MIRKILALPQVWLVGFTLAGLALGMALPISLPPILRVAGFLSFGAGCALMIWAAGTMSQANTSFMPGRRPDHLVTWGPFGLSRNPIYLGDLIIMASLMVALDCLAGLILLPAFALVLDRHFIRHEESVIESHFGAAFQAYKAKVRRWF